MSDRIMEWLDESQRLADQATEGPWEWDSHGEVSQHWSRPEPWETVVSAEGIEREEDGEFIVGSRTRFPQAVAALREVAELHRRTSDIHEPDDFCAECSSFHRTVEWPCPTRRAIAVALGLEGDDDDGMG